MDAMLVISSLPKAGFGWHHRADDDKSESSATKANLLSDMWECEPFRLA
jgi:hypothetical protein